MKPELQIFTTCDYEPFAVFYWGTEGYELTKEMAIDEYRQFVDDEDFPWNKCSADHPGVEACFGVVFE